MVIERQNGNVLVHLGPKIQSYPEELIRQRRGHNGHVEYLIRWNLENGTGSRPGTCSAESSMENFLMWMSADDAYANCPTLLGKRTPKEESSRRIFPPDVTLDEPSLSEMKADVRNLVQRAAWQMASPTVPQSSILNTIQVLSAYASIGSLMGVFKETGALSLLMKMLCNEEEQIRRSAGKILRALASHDAGSRAYVLLSLSRQDGIEQHMDFDSRYTLLELFAETTSSEEHCMSFEGIPLPQIPGKLLFSLVKRYLCATSLVDKRHSATDPGGEHAASEPFSACSGGSKRLQREFDFSLALASLISELVQAMGWDRGWQLRTLSRKPPWAAQSIFQSQAPSGATVPPATQVPQKETSTFKLRSAFPSRNSYVEYVQEKLVRGMRVRMLEDYEKVCAGDEGEFLQSNDGTPPIQVYWESLGRTYWVHWHMVEIIGSSGHADEKAQEKLTSLTASLRRDTGKAATYRKPLRGLYLAPYLTDHMKEKSETLSQAEWWELLFFVKKLEQQEQQEVVQLIQQNEKLPELDEEGLIPLSVSVELAQKVLQFLSRCCQSNAQSDLRSSHVYLKYSSSEGGTEQDGQKVDLAPAKCGGLSKAMGSRKTEEDSLSTEAPSPAPSAEENTDTQLVHELLRVVQESIDFLHHLATLDRDCAVSMCCLRTKEALAKVVEKHGSGLPRVTELGDLVSKCEKYAGLYKKMTASILAGCIQVVLGQIEEHRQTHQPINIPFFDVFLHSLCQGCSTEVKDDKCWERVEVSSNPQQASKLTDGNPKTYWESNGNSTSHHINIYMHRGVIIRQMSLLVTSEDSSYMPARIMVMGGESAASVSIKLNMVTVPPSASRVILLENMNCFWPIIQIKIKRCQQGGIDTRVRGIEVLGPKPTFWPIFKEQLCRRTYLFYTTKAHTWCQEISEDRMQLLQLFNRLNSALRHEQVFADRFLPDDEAAQALGKTCWEALISPLVQSITTPDPSGISPLSWLLSQYLENLEASRSAKSRAAIFNSRVRRLSHLLVHVDSSSPEPEELKPPVKSSECLPTPCLAVKKPSSTTGITQCWKGVVQQQVKLFLESSWQAPDFVERYCNTYLRLRTAMEELFGQQMSFMLALCHGFSGGLLQLSFLTAMHVSEQFARYIDRWIQESWADSGNVETLRRLQQSLEPVLFLAGLELANTFEHFYRYYLGDRLLSQGKTWLECAVVEHIGLCFPNRFPQQMLKNLSELEEQQQQFHLFQLEQLDKHLLELDQDGNWEAEEMEEGEVRGEGAPSLWTTQEVLCPQEAEVKVLALSPRCWTISSFCYLEDPARFFPESLSQHLSKFADFYTQSQSRFGLEHTKPRRLQWTWLGHAELEYQGCLLHVSTLQMYILLCFNTTQEVSVERLFQATGLSPELLDCALKPLTTNGILTQSQGKYGDGILSFPSERLWLLPKQTYFDVEENKGSALERKRNTICCLLLEILKEERELHIDSLVFRVRNAGLWPCSPGSVPKFSRFCCSSADVLSCVLHLLNQGSIQRREDHPHLLQCVSTEPPALPAPRNQPQVVFQTVEIKKAPTAPCPEKRQAFSTFR
uniref:Cullin 7 n=1 Tax=Podarcis muralis TaxID=64176 RepID=A0A670KC88_PODMU